MSATAPIHSNLAYALAYARQGWPVFPLHEALSGGVCTCGKDCGNPGKHPRTKHGLKDATCDESIIRQWWTRWPEAPIAIITGPRSGLLVVDLDPRSGADATWARLMERHEPPVTIRCQTGGGGEHLYFRAPKQPIKSRAGALGDGIDIKCDGGYVVAPPSLHASGKRYQYAECAGPGDIELQECLPWIVHLASKTVTPKSPQKSADTMGWMATAFQHAGWLGERTASGGWAIKCPWESGHTTGGSCDGSTVVFPPTADKTLGWAHCSHGHCESKTQSDFKAALPRASRDYASSQYPAPIPAAAGQSDDWLADLIRKENGGTIIACHANAITIMAHDARWSGVLAYDSFAERIVFRKDAPWHADDGRTPAGASVSDQDSVRLACWFHRFWSIRISPEVAWQALQTAARANEVHPVREYLLAARDKWDGTKRIDAWLATYLGAAPIPYHSAIGRRWLISAVARIMRPGCQADASLVLEGEQNAGKSRALRTLAGSDWFADDIGDIRNKDASDALRGKWIVELAELSAMKRADNEANKAFLSRRFDHYRPAYERVTIDRGRQCVFAGTTNAFEYQSDPTGARRFWAVRCGRVDLTALERDRDQLWAEAVLAFESGDQWWLTDEEIPDQVVEQEERREVDPWESTVLEWADGERGLFSIDRVLSMALNMNPSEREPIHSRRVGSILRANGFAIQAKLGARGSRSKMWGRVVKEV